ncbi:hypothetical protein RPD76_07590 [Methylomonas sp. MV1]|uniref:hypothetical protein n=1 Tax=Methylomonas sp. MV1 TaxID=3073620 RepID=UPI0028A2E34D|nr:hypothetical protein [Methylomonas sp. MV1]MDT4329768.1 hypothetical protein [Methylomonas sp. MV1]
MPNIYVRTQPKTGLKIRHRCGLAFTDVWKELTDIDNATRAALEEDPYLEVSDSPTVLVEVAATTQAGAIESAGADTNNPVKSEANEGSTGAIAAEGTDTGTAAPVAKEANTQTGNEQLTERDPEAPAPEGLADGDDIKIGVDAPVADAAEKSETELREDAIKAGIVKLDPNNPEHWLKDGRPSTIALRDVAGVAISSAERDAVWDELQAAVEREEVLAEVQSARSAG